MRVVVDFDTFGGRFEVKRVSEAAEQFCLGGAFGHFAAKAFTRIARRAFDQFGLFAAFGHQDFDLAPRLGGQCVLHQIRVFDRM